MEATTNVLPLFDSTDILSFPLQKTTYRTSRILAHLFLRQHSLGELFTKNLFPTNRSINLAVSDDVLAQRRAAMEARGKDAWKPQPRKRNVTMALKAYAALTTSAALGAVRVVRD